MGDCTSSAAHKEQLLLVFFQDVPTALKDTIGKMFPSAELTTYRSQKGVPIPKGTSHKRLEMSGYVDSNVQGKKMSCCRILELTRAV